ncbi:portal protein [Gordonia Phage Schomber]|nr:portal protein [Gordonia Phage Schomber]
MAGGRFLPGLFETKATASAGDAPARAAGAALQTAGMPLGATVGQWDIQQGVTRGLERVSIVFRCVDAIATTQSRIPINIVKAAPGIVDLSKGEVVDDADLWKLLNRKTNKYETAQQLRYRLSATLLLSRRGAFLEVVQGTQGKPAELHLLMPGSVQPIPDPKKFVSGYQITRGDAVIETLPPERVIWIKVKPHPIDPYSQLTPLMAAGISVDTDSLARIFNRNFLANDGRPGMLITIQGRLNQEDAAEIKSRFSGGVHMAGRTSVIEADGLEAADLAASPRDLQWHELLNLSKEDIQLAFGVPESVMGNASGRTFDNADAERENYYIDTVQPHCEAIATGLDPITGETDDDTMVAFDFSGVDVLQRIAARKREEHRAEVAAGLKTIDEYRESAGLEAFNVVGSRVLFHTSGLAIAKSPDDQAGIMQYRQVGTDPGEGLQAAAASESGALKGVRKGIREADRQRGNTEAANSIRQRALRLVKSFDVNELETKAGLPELETKDRAERQKERDDRKRTRRKRTAAHPLSTTTSTSGPAIKTHPYLGLRYKMEGFIEGQLTQWDTRQENVVAERLTHVKFRKDTRHWESKEGETKKLPKSQKCKYCKDEATKAVIWAEGRAYVPVCDAHVQKAKTSLREKNGDMGEVDGVRDLQDMRDKQEKKALDPSYAVNTEQWAEDLVSGMGSFVRKAMEREARRAAQELKDMGIGELTEINFDSKADPLEAMLGRKGISNALDPIYQDVMDIVRKAAENQSNRLQKAIKEMDDSGASIKEIERKVRQMTGTRAPWRKNLSVNVTTTAVEAARGAIFQKMPGKFIEKTWVSQHDHRTRPTHAKADGQTKLGNQFFRVGSAKMLFPCQPGAPIEEVANCRCYATYSISESAQRALENL